MAKIDIIIDDIYDDLSHSEKLELVDLLEQDDYLPDLDEEMFDADLSDVSIPTTTYDESKAVENLIYIIENRHRLSLNQYKIIQDLADKL